MWHPVLIAPILRLRVIPEDSPINTFEDKRNRESILSSYFVEKKAKDKKDEVHAQGRTKEGLKNSGEEDQI